MTTAVQPPPVDKAFPTHHVRKSPSPRRKSKSPPRSLWDPDRIPTQEELAACADLPILNKDGQSIPFKDLYSKGQRQLVVFVRHFYCGICQDYLRLLHQSITPSELAGLSKPTQITVIGCGEPEVIEDYASFTHDFPYPMYADPTRQLHDHLEMISTLYQGPSKPDYQTSNFVAMVSRNMWQMISAGSNFAKGGNFSQLGGEMLFEDGKVVFCHRMQNTRDHTEVPELKKILGL